MQQKHNWILLNKHESLNNQPVGSKRIIYHKPIIVSTSQGIGQVGQFIHRPTREALDRISSINRLNDRIRRRLEDTEVYASTSGLDEIKRDDEITGTSEASRRQANRVVDEHFDFIREETETDVDSPMIPREDYLIHRKDSNGSVDAVFEKRSPQISNIQIRPYRRQQRSLTDPLNVPVSSRGDARSSHNVHNVPIHVMRKRADSLDSGSTRLGYVTNRDPNPTPITQSDWNTPVVSQKPSFKHRRRESFQRHQRLPSKQRQYPSSTHPSFTEYDGYRPDVDRMPTKTSRRLTRRPGRIMPRKTPSLLRRDSYFYKKCDICFNQPRPDGIPCPACNSFAPRHRNLRRYPRGFDYQPRIVSTTKMPSRIHSSRIQPVTIEPYFEGINEETPGDESSSMSSVIQPVSSSKVWTASTIPPRTSSQMGYYPQQPNPYLASPRRQKILNPESLQHHPSYLNYVRGPVQPNYLQQMRPHTPTGSRQSTVIWPASAGPAWKSIDHRRRASPVFRYGKSVPKWLYDYDAYAEEQRQKERKRRKNKVIALTLVFLFFALIVAAGVVLAALN